MSYYYAHTSFATSLDALVAQLRDYYTAVDMNTNEEALDYMRGEAPIIQAFADDNSYERIGRIIADHIEEDGEFTLKHDEDIAEVAKAWAMVKGGLEYAVASAA